jgi:hypothetical protein
MPGGLVMASLVQLNLRVDPAKPENANLHNPEREEARPFVVGKRTNLMINKFAHKAAKEFGRTGPGIFSK